MKPIRLMAGFFTVGLWTLLSRVLGFARDIMMAAFLGTGPVAEAFLIALSLPNMFRRFFAEGAFNMAFVPMFSKKLEADDDPLTFAQDAFLGLGFVLMIFTGIAVAFMPALVTLMAAGFRGDVRFELAVAYGQVAFPYILFISLAALLSGVLNATGRFVAAAAAPVLLNIFFVGIMVVMWLVGGPTVVGGAYVFDATVGFGRGLAWAVPFAGIAQVTLVFIAARRAGFPMALRMPRLTPDLKRLAIIAIPAVMAGGVLQINLLVGRQVASTFDGAIAWLSYADRLYQLPLGVIAIAIGVVLLPDLSRRLQAGDEAGGQDAFNRASEVALALTIPAAIALIVIPIPLVSVLFQRGAFTADDTAATALAVAVYGLGLPAFVLQKALQPLFYARGDTKRPFYYAIFAMILNAVLAFGLRDYIGFIAAAVGTTLTSWAMVGQLWWGARGMGKASQFDARFKRRITRIIASAVAMGAVLFGLAIVLQPMLGSGGTRYIGLLILVVSGIVSYFAIGQMLGAFRLTEFKAAMRRS
ncbi:putative peptidoglycan lipid II flippase [Loktanella ponticola]|uniref:Probable lipid II flippase MurJ n=1 Tax=Yoonia ponticola TaxID=1524255 RepID=A0A7W9BH79_9RHOB|nr:putative peptidoglycan lipid II flippase [Yoonia ponticola]